MFNIDHLMTTKYQFNSFSSNLDAYVIYILK
jgi:hypothetical protein